MRFVDILKTSFLFAALALGVANAVLADNHSAVASVRKVAEELGDASAQYVLGNMYAHGQMVKQDYQEALLWYKKAASQGHLEAQTKLGALYIEGPSAIRNYPEARRWLEVAAERGNSEAQYYMGEIYRRALGVKEQPSTAREWYFKAAEQNHPRAQLQVAKIYHSGIGARRDLTVAKYWYKKADEQGVREAGKVLASLEAKTSATKSVDPKLDVMQSKAEAGDPSSQYQLGINFLSGKEADYKQAAKWLMLAAEQSHEDAQYELANLFLKGKGVAKDRGEAIVWLTLAANKGSKKAETLLTEVEGTKTPRQPVEDKYSKISTLATRGDAKAQFELGLILLKDPKIDSDPVKAAEWLLKSANQGHAEAQYQLGNLYMSGTGVQKNLGEAINWFEKAAKQGIIPAKTAMSQIKASGYDEIIRAESGNPQAQYETGIKYLAKGTDNGNKEALRWVRLAAENNYPPAQVKLAEFYSNGDIVTRDEKQAFAWYSTAAELDNAEAQFQLGEAYSRGKGTQRNNGLAARWYRQAAKQRHPEAQKRLGGCLICD